MRPLVAAPLAVIAALLGGCSSVLTEGTAAGAGAAGAAIAHGVTQNAGVTTGIGLGVAAAARAGLQYAERRVHETEQNDIAAVAPWRVVHDVPIEANEHGQVAVSRALTGNGFLCKEIVFSVEHPKAREFYTATVCRDGAHWKWATAEPATERWGSLQ